MVVLDTCTIIELCLDTPSISAACRKKIDGGGTILSVSFAEIALKISKKKLFMDPSPQELYDEYSGIPTIKIVAIGCQEWFDAIELDWRHRDPADRLIVGYAKRHSLSIVTTDHKIKRFHKKVIW